MTDGAVSALEDVRRYYDQNTPRFARFGEGHKIGAIHRAVRPEPGAVDADPLRTLDRLVLDELTRLSDGFVAPIDVIDLGCGLGSSLVYLARERGVRGTGVTLSGVQAARARENVKAHGLEGQIEILEGSYLALPDSVQPAAVVFSIEAFLYGPDPAAYFASAAAHVAPGGALVVCDDFLGPAGCGELSPRDQRCIDDVRDGWVAYSLVSVGRALELAEAAGLRLERNIDLSHRLKLGRARDHVIALTVAVTRHLPLRNYWLRSLRGGHALQQAIRRNLIEFRCLVWRRPDAAGG